MVGIASTGGERGCGHSVRLGVDLVTVSDVADSISEFGERYLRRVFTNEERARCVTLSGDPDVSRLAARFAAKEATIKALGMASETVLTDIEVMTDEDGRPELRLRGRYLNEATMLGASSIALSMSHDGPYAIASVVVLTQPGTPDEQHEVENWRPS